MSWHEPDSRYHVPIKRCEVAVYFQDGTHITDVFNMILQDGTERVIDRVEIDGETYVKERTCTNTNINGYGLRFECSKCGYSAIVHNCAVRLDELPNFCPHCGGARLIDG